MLDKLPGINGLLVKASQDLITLGKHTYNERTQSGITELCDYVMFGNPTKRYININSRKNNFCAQIMEMMMVLSGNPDLHFLSLFLPRAKDYSDDGGKTWRGNYGIRLRGNKTEISKLCNDPQFERYDKDNLGMVVNTLINDPSSRQCFITIGDSNLDRFINTVDTPCTMTLVFRVHDDKLNLTTFMRSNDLIFGFSGVNYFIFTCLQELVSSITEISLGRYCHHPVSFHVYDWKKDQAENISKETEISDISLEGGLFKGFTTLAEFDKLSKSYFDSFDATNIEYFADKVIPKCPNDNLGFLLLCTYAYVNNLDWNQIINIAEEYILNYDPQLKDLFKRDPFFNKRVTNVQ